MLCLYKGSGGRCVTQISKIETHSKFNTFFFLQISSRVLISFQGTLTHYFNWLNLHRKNKNTTFSRHVKASKF